MKQIPIPEVKDAYILEVDRHTDDRGYFQEVYSVAKNAYAIAAHQINISYSWKNVIRGMHVVPFAKLCTCVRGQLFDVVADVREGSSTYLGWKGVWLTAHNHKQLYVPPGCAHGFFAAEDETILLYLQDRTYNPSLEVTIHWRDPKLNIAWPLPQPVESNYILSPKDGEAGCL